MTTTGYIPELAALSPAASGTLDCEKKYAYCQLIYPTGQTTSHINGSESTGTPPKAKPQAKSATSSTTEKTGRQHHHYGYPASPSKT